MPMSTGAQSSVRDDYDRFAATYDSLDGGSAASALGIDDARRQLLSSVQGKVLEVAVGTGLNLPLYPWAQVVDLKAIDLSLGMLREAEGKLSLGGDQSKVELLQMDVKDLGFQDQTFDTVVDTFSLCVFDDPLKALQEMRRVIKDDGQLLLLENSRSENGAVAAYQDLTAPFIAKTGGKGCMWNQDVDALVRAANFRVRTSAQVGGGFFRYIVATPA